MKPMKRSTLYIALFLAIACSFHSPVKNLLNNRNKTISLTWLPRAPGGLPDTMITRQITLLTALPDIRFSLTKIIPFMGSDMASKQMEPGRWMLAIRSITSNFPTCCLPDYPVESYLDNNRQLYGFCSCKNGRRLIF